MLDWTPGLVAPPIVNRSVTVTGRTTMTPLRDDDEGSWRHEALRELKGSIISTMGEKHDRQKDRITSCETTIKEIRLQCADEIKAFRRDMLEFFVSKSELKPTLELVNEKQRIPTALIYGFCVVVLLAVVYTWLKMGGLHPGGG